MMIGPIQKLVCMEVSQLDLAAIMYSSGTTVKGLELFGEQYVASNFMFLLLFLLVKWLVS